MLDVLSKVKQAEDAAQQLLSDAQQKAVAIRADAQRQGKTILDNAKADAAKLSEETVSRAQQDAQVWLKNSRASCENECKAMAERSREKLTAAANLIAERIVNTL